jgi:hypothetical protein
MDEPDVWGSWLQVGFLATVLLTGLLFSTAKFAEWGAVFLVLVIGGSGLP